jgi:hypothetical protein
MSVPEPCLGAADHGGVVRLRLDVRRDLGDAARMRRTLKLTAPPFTLWGVTSSRRSPGTGHFCVVPTGTSAR